MKLKHIKKMAEKETESDIKDCVITVPEFWSYKERQALLDSSQMAGLNVLGLINENTAGLIAWKFLLFSLSLCNLLKNKQRHFSMHSTENMRKIRLKL